MFHPLGVAGDSVEYKWAEADGSVTSMSPTGSKLPSILFRVDFVGVFGDLKFFQVRKKSLFIAGSKLVFPAPKR